MTNEVDGPTLARWLGVSGKAVYELAKLGITVRAPGGRFDLEQSVRRYCEHIRGIAAQRSAAAAVEPAGVLVEVPTITP
jgi:phage terminase Nu1 subunit (DNA packaging protein)